MDIIILYIDDDRSSSEVFVDYLAQIGYKVFFFQYPEEALKEYRSIKPDLVLLDVQMPEMSGIEVAKIIREKDQNIPILFLSGTKGHKNALKGLEIGANDYIRKDVHVDELCARIKKELDRNTIKSGDNIYLTPNTYVDRYTKSIVSYDTTHRFSDTEFRIVVLLADNVNSMVPYPQVHERALLNRLRSEKFTYKTITKIRKVIRNDKSLELNRIRGFISLKIN